MKRILINSSYGDELRVALVDGAKLYDFDTESPEINLLKGSIFKATVSRIETSLDAAFVNFGSERHGFLPLKDLSNEYFETHKGKKKCILEEGQEIVVQVTKEERGTKGAALSTQIGLAGRFLVLMPNSSRSGGISRRISGDERDEIKKSLDKLNIPESMSVIVRTNGLGRSTEELSLDLNYLLALWDEVCISTPNAKAPSLIYKDDKLIVRVVRDYFKEDIEEILVDDKDTYDEALKFMQAVIPDHAEKIKFYNELILFLLYQLKELVLKKTENNKHLQLDLQIRKYLLQVFGLPILKLKNQQLNDEQFLENLDIVLKRESEEYIENKSQEITYEEESIYSKNLNYKESLIMKNFHNENWDKKWTFAEKFLDPRLRFFAARHIFRNQPTELPRKVFSLLHKKISERLLSLESKNFTTIPAAMEEVDTLSFKIEDEEENFKMEEQIYQYNIYINLIEEGASINWEGCENKILD